MLTRSKLRTGKCRSECEKSSSERSSATIQARVLAAEAQHLRRLTDLERAVAEAEHRAHVASLEASSRGSRRSRNSSRVQDWLDHGAESNNSHITSFPPPTVSHSPIPVASVPYLAPEDAMVELPLDIVPSEGGITRNPLTSQPQSNAISPPCTTASPYIFNVSQSCPTASALNPAYFSAPVYTIAPQGGTFLTAAPAPRPGASTGAPWKPTGPAEAETLLHARSVGIGTHFNANNNYCFDNTNKNFNSKQNDTLQLAEAVASIAAAAASRVPAKVSVTNLPIFDGKPTDWLIFKRVYDSTSASYSPAENLARIGSALRGPARDAVAVLLAAAWDPREVVCALEVEFARPERIILAELASVRALSRISHNETAKEINAFACRVRHCIEVVRLLNVPEYLPSPELSNEIVGKFTNSLRSRWTDFAYERERDPVKKFRLELLSEFLMHEANLKSRYDFFDPVKRDIRDINVKPVRCHATTNVTLPSSTKVSIFNKVCLFCNKVGHLILHCKDFEAISIDERWKWVTEKKVCYKCFVKGDHFYRKCKKFSCENIDCLSKGTHHTLLHRNATLATVTNISTSPQESGLMNGTVPEADIAAEDSIVVAHNSTPQPPQRPLLKVVPVNVSGPKGTVSTFALLDDGSTATLVDSSITDAVGATGNRSRLRVNTVGGLSKDTEVIFVSLELRGCHSSQTFKLDSVRSIPNLSLTSQSIKFKDLLSYNYLSDIVEELTYDEAKPMLLIGIDNWHLTVPHTVRRGGQSQPVAALTSLGWVLFGCIKSKSSPVEFIHHLHASDTASMDQQLSEYFRVDSIGISKEEYRSSDDQRAISILNQTTRRLSNGRFETGLLWRANIDNVPNSRDHALSRFISLERKMRKDEAYADAYRKNIRSIIQKGYAELCTEPPNSASVAWYLPHFGVLHPQKQKLRVVHDAAATSSGVSLNSLLLPGPDLLQPLLGILMRFREGAVALNGDIREMFPQTKIRIEDRDAQRFLWREHPSQPIQEFRMTSMIFGATSSPFTAIFLKNRNAEENRSFSPAAADAIIRDHYMDDYLGSVDSVDEAAQLASDIVEIHSKACLEMRSWVSNQTEALSSIRPDLCTSEATSVNVRILGVVWDVHTDTLSFTRSSLEVLPSKLTKRSALAYLMRIYDPLGFLTPLIVKGRTIFQETWKIGIGWDQELPPSLVSKWNAWFTEISQIKSTAISRHYLCGRQALSAELHVFGDASEVAYACVAYWRFTCSNGDVVLSLIGGKARLAPIKPVSIPRLELQAALIAARFASYITEVHKRKPSKIVLWTDSLTVLRWLRTNVRSLKTFVAHRVGEILELTIEANWRYVPTTLNVADDATRTNTKFDITSRWFSGPSFLAEPHSQWPSEPSGHYISLGENEMKQSSASPDSHFIALIVSSLPSPPIVEPTRFSRWFRLLRATARVLRCAKTFRALLGCKNLNSKTSNNSGSVSTSLTKFPVLDAEELGKAERNLLLHSQLQHFEEEYTATLKGSPFPKASKLHSFTICIDDDGLLRLKGRISAARDVDIDKNPIVLFGKHHTVKLLIQFYHERFAHGGSNIIINELRQRFYIVGIRCAVKSVLRTCRQCAFKKKNPSSPPIGDLPAERLSHHVRPFTNVGLDYFGPITVSVGRRTEKRWVALFTCLSVRAVHLEVVNSLSTDSAIMALRRFIARRGSPEIIFSDNGTAFVGANRELRKFYEEPVQEFAANSLIRWKFIPPAAPFMGGCWERLVRSVKTALVATLKERSPTEETLNTFLLEAEAILNSRPLTHVDTDPDAEQAITPFHFLLGSSSPYSPLAQVDDADLIRRIRWRKGLRLADHFWVRWLKEYLPSLIPKAATAPTLNLCVGDLVLIADSNLPRGVWPRGRVIRVLPGSDGVVRIADVRTTHGVLRRPTKKLIHLNTTASPP